MTAHAAPAWRLVQIAELVRRGEELHLRAMNLLPPEARAEISEGAVATMAAAEIEVLATAAAESAEIADQIRQLAQSLPDEDVGISYEDVREAAAADLARGMLDAERVLVGVTLALQLADIPPETAYADCTAEQLARLADAIGELGRSWRP